MTRAGDKNKNTMGGRGEKRAKERKSFRDVETQEGRITNLELNTRGRNNESPRKTVREIRIVGEGQSGLLQSNEDA